MELILWRHADAEDAAPGKPDAERSLTAKGEKQARRVAGWLKKQLPEDTRVVVSPARRAQQTAQALVKRFETSRDVGTSAGPHPRYARGHRKVPSLADSTTGARPRYSLPGLRVASARESE